MALKHIAQLIRTQFAEVIINFFEHEPNNLTIIVSKNQLIAMVNFIRDNQDIRCDQLLDICGVDYLGQENKEKRFEVVYHFLSMSQNIRLRLKVALNEEEEVPTLNNIFASAPWYEREVFDMYGIKFDGHQNLKRILTDYNFEGHPLKKDFPVSGYDEVFYDQNQGKVTYRPLTLTQEYRSFDFTMPWDKSLAKAKEAIDILNKENPSEDPQ